jgi:glutathione S-transferase
MFTIYGRANSSNVRKVLWLLAELGVENFERLDYGRGYESCQSPEYLALNPNAVVPTMVNGDLVLWESNTQLRYLAAKYERDDLYPAELTARAKVDMWLDWQLTTAITGIRNLFQGLHVKDPDYIDELLLKKSLVQATHAMKILNDHLAEHGGYVAADNLTVADCALGMYVHRWYALPIDRASYPALDAYYALLKEREPFRKWIVEMGV